MSILNGSRQASAVDVGALLDVTATERIASIVASGALVSIYRTRDHGALGVTVTADGDVEKEYFRSAEELADWLGAVDSALEARPPGPSSVKRRS